MPNRPDVLVFDVVETLASLDAVRERLRAAGLAPQLLPAWFTRILRDAMALSLAGGYAPFAEVAASALRAELAPSVLGDDTVGEVVGGFTELGPQPDAVAAVRAATAAGLRVFTLSNGSEAATTAFLDRAGLRDQVERVLSVDDVGVWKPAAAVYGHAVRAAGVAPERVALVAVHSWDVDGARRAGLTTGWCPRLETEPTSVFAAADVVADALDAVVRGLAALPA